MRIAVKENSFQGIILSHSGPDYESMTAPSSNLAFTCRDIVNNGNQTELFKLGY